MESKENPQKNNYQKFLFLFMCVLGSIFIGFFANSLNTVIGIFLFSLGILLLVISIIQLTKHND